MLTSFRLTRSSYASASKLNVRRHQLRQRLFQKVNTKPTPALRIISKPNIRKLTEKGKQQQANKQALVQELRNRRVLKKEEELPKKIEEKRDVVRPVQKKIVKEEPAVSQRPTRKTKEAAAIYMEILGHKLVSEGKNDDDNVSIDSFPELPNVRRTEQREIELKAKAKVGDKRNESVKLSKKVQEKRVPKVEEQKIMTRNKSLLLQSESGRNKADLKISPNSEGKATKARNRRIELEAIKASMIKAYDTSSDSDESFLEAVKQAKSKEIKSENLTAEPENIFNDSDEEPLVRLTLAKSTSSIKSNISTSKVKSEMKTKAVSNKKDNVEIKPPEKAKRECTKKFQNYLFSSSDDDEKCFHGFVESSTPTKVKEECPVVASADLLRKDVGRRFGKGKVNMSNEQIEKWLKDSAMAGGGTMEEDEMVKYGERIPTETTFDLNLLRAINTEGLKSSLLIEKRIEKRDVKLESKEKPKTHTVLKTPEKPIPIPKAHSNDRKLIFRKEKPAVPNVNAFSANNESSVYAFGEENEEAISTPFRRPMRRPSSTATSKSEDDSCKQDDSNKSSGRFRMPTKPSSSKQEVSLVLSTNESPNTSIAVQVNLETSETQNETSDSEQLFYIPLQPAKLAVKLGAELTSTTNQKVVMRAKIVTQEGQMCPPVHTLQKHKSTEKLNIKSAICKTPETDDFKYKVPSSPSASSSSSAKICSRRQSTKPKTRAYEVLTPVNVTEFPSIEGPAQVVEAPTFHPNDKEFQDPIEYIEKIRQVAEQFGICRIVPPSSFKPECKVSDDMRFTAYNQYVHKMLHRWGPNFKELMAIKKYLETQNITLTHPPWVRNAAGKATFI